MEDSPYRFAPMSLQDAEAWAELTNHLAEVDGTEEFYEAEDLAEELEDPRLDPRKDTLAVWFGNQVVGFGTVRVPANPGHQDGRVSVRLDGGVHAEHRRRGLGTRIMDFLEARGAELKEVRHPGTDWYFATGGGREGSSARAFHQRRGYQVARYFHLMSRELTGQDAEPTEQVRLGDGLSIRAPRPEDEQAVLAAHTAAFVDHWGSAAPDPEVWHQRWTARSNRFAESRIVVDENGSIAGAGQVLAYSLCGQWVDGEIYVNLVGTVPEARGRGLGSAALAHTVAAAADSGKYSTIDLDVDTESLTGATRLYERLGFTVKHTTAAMRRYPSQPAEQASRPGSPAHE